MLWRRLTSLLTAVVFLMGALAAGGMAFPQSSAPSQPRHCCASDKACGGCGTSHHTCLSTISVCSCDDAMTTTMLEPGLIERTNGVVLRCPAFATIRGADTRPARGYERPAEKPPPA